MKLTSSILKDNIEKRNLELEPLQIAWKIGNRIIDLKNYSCKSEETEHKMAALCSVVRWYQTLDGLKKSLLSLSAQQNIPLMHLHWKPLGVGIPVFVCFRFFRMI